MSNKKVVIVGAGPAGLFAADYLSDKADVTVIDKGKSIGERVCYEKDNGKCIGCKPCNKTHGVIGAGLMSDVKLLFNRRVGNNLDEIISQQENEELITDVQNYFSQFGINEVQGKTQKVEELERKALQNEIDFIYPRQTHVGTDKIKPVAKQMIRELELLGVNFELEREVKDLTELDYDFVLLAPGRVGGGSGWLEKVLKQNNIEYSYRPVDIGVRVEVPHQIADPITDITWDMKFYIRTKSYDDPVRTFCTCPKGFVGREKYEEFNVVNGEASKEKKSGNTNFAILTTIPLTKPMSNSNEYAKQVAQTFYYIGGNKIVLQRFGDLEKGCRSREENQKRYVLQPTLTDVTWGDISLGMPGRQLQDIKEAIHRFDKVIPGLASSQTLLYAPEIKFHGLNIQTDKYLHAKDNIYVAGDGAGLSRGIVGAAASGFLAAKGIERNL